MAEGAALEMPCTACPYRGFESHPVRFVPKISVDGGEREQRLGRGTRGSSPLGASPCWRSRKLPGENWLERARCLFGSFGLNSSSPQGPDMFDTDTRLCPRCTSSRVIDGRLYSANTLLVGAIFEPEDPDPPRVGLMRLVITTKGRSHLCLACGLLWAIVNASEASDKIRKHGGRQLAAKTATLLSRSAPTRRLRPEFVMSIDERVRRQQQKKAERQEARRERNAGPSSSRLASHFPSQ